MLYVLLGLCIKIKRTSPLEQPTQTRLIKLIIGSNPLRVGFDPINPNHKHVKNTNIHSSNPSCLALSFSSYLFLSFSSMLPALSLSHMQKWWDLVFNMVRQECTKNFKKYRSHAMQKLKPKGQLIQLLTRVLGLPLLVWCDLFHFCIPSHPTMLLFKLLKYK